VRWLGITLAAGALAGGLVSGLTRASDGGGAPPWSSSEVTVERVRGVVTEAIPVEGYTYLRLDGVERWIAVPGRVKFGAEVSVQLLAEKARYQSRQLEREFEELGFGYLSSRNSVDERPQGSLEGSSKPE